MNKIIAPRTMKDHPFFSELWEFACKVWVWAVVIAMGLAGKFGLYLLGEKKLTFIQLCGSFLLAVSVGVGSAIICYIYYPAPPGGISIQGAFIVPISGILSDRIAMFIFSLDVKRVAELVSSRDWLTIIKVLNKRKDKKGE